MPSETIKLTAKFKLRGAPEGLDELFRTYREIVNFLISYAFENNITSFKRLKKRDLQGLTQGVSRIAEPLPLHGLPDGDGDIQKL